MKAAILITLLIFALPAYSLKVAEGVCESPAGGTFNPDGSFWMSVVGFGRIPDTRSHLTGNNRFEIQFFQSRKAARRKLC